MPDAPIVTRQDLRNLFELIVADTPGIHRHQNALARACQQLGFVLEVGKSKDGKLHFRVTDFEPERPEPRMHEAP